MWATELAHDKSQRRPPLAGRKALRRGLKLTIQAVSRSTIRRTHGATIATVGKAIGQVVRQLLSHCAAKLEWSPCEVARTKADTIQTMMAESMALNKIGANRAGICILFSWISFAD
jgi:hypothetical protein